MELILAISTKLYYYKSVKNVLVRLFFITFGCFIAAGALEGFLVPNKLIDGGIVGVAMMTSYLTKLPLGIFLVAFNVPFLLFAFKKFGKAFLLQTFYALIMLGIFVTLDHHYLKVATQDLILVAVFGGAFLGLGVGLVLRNNASLDGTEILAIRFNQRTSWSVGEIIMFLNVFIFLSAGFFFGWDRAMYSCLTYFTAFRVIDMVLQGFDESKSIFVVSDKSEEIGKGIMEDLGKSVTYLDAEGGYSRVKKKVVYSVISRFEIQKIKDLVMSIDPNSFIVIEDIHEVDGTRYRKSTQR